MSMQINKGRRLPFINKFLSSTFIFCIGVILLGLASCQDKDYAKIPEEDPNVEKKPTEKQKIARGEYLVTTIGCADCHSPKKMGERGPEFVEGREFSGFQNGQKLPAMNQEALAQGWMLMTGDLTAAVGPWGVSFAANISSDETGIGNWSEEQFKTALRKGKYKGLENGRDLLPPMPWFNFAHLTEDDMEAMFLYLKSTPPVENVVPGPIPPDQLASIK